MTKVKLSVIDMHKLCQVEYYDKCSPINNIAVLWYNILVFTGRFL